MGLSQLILSGQKLTLDVFDKNMKINKYNLLLIIAAIVIFGFLSSPAKAEQTGTSGESGATAYIKTTYNSLVSLGYGSDAAGAWGNWGAYLNRIRSAGEWVPNSAASPNDVREGKTFYSNSRTQQVGTYPAATSCVTQQYYASHASASKANNCGLDWVAAEPAVDGDDKLDPRTGLVWSKVLRSFGGAAEFTLSTGSSWSWNATASNNIAVGNKTATQLCSERGNGWRLPTLKEHFQAYVDGAYWALTNTSNTFWSITESGNGTQSRYLTSTTGISSNGNFTTAYFVRCVR